MRVLLAFAFCVLLGCAAQSGDSASRRVVSDVVLTLSLSDREIVVGDTLIATLNVHNVSARSREVSFETAATHEFELMRGESSIKLESATQEQLIRDRSIEGSQSVSFTQGFHITVAGELQVAARFLAKGFEGDVVATFTSTR